MEVEELEDLLGPDDVDVDFRRIVKEARDEKGRATFETFSADGLSEFLVARRSRWDKYKRKWNAPWRQNSLTSASEGWWQEGREQQRVGSSSVEISLRYILMYSTRGGSNISQLFDTSEKPDHFVASRRRWLESQEQNGARQESEQNEWHDMEYQGVMAKAPPCSVSTLKTPLP